MDIDFTHVFAALVIALIAIVAIAKILSLGEQLREVATASQTKDHEMAVLRGSLALANQLIAEQQHEIEQHRNTSDSVSADLTKLVELTSPKPSGSAAERKSNV